MESTMLMLIYDNSCYIFLTLLFLILFQSSSIILPGMYCTCYLFYFWQFNQFWYYFSGTCSHN